MNTPHLCPNCYGCIEHCASHLAWCSCATRRPKLTLTVGLPGSGKSTWAAAELARDPRIVNVNRDAIRLELGAQYNPRREKHVRRIRDERIEAALRAGKDVIDDDTNLVPEGREQLRRLAEACGADFETNDSFMRDFTVEQCIERDRIRGTTAVGKDVIEKLYYMYWQHQPRPENVGRDAIICDLDGTLALAPSGHWDYNRDMTKDSLNLGVRDAVAAMSADSYILLVSGRKERHRAATEEWLRMHTIFADRLYMRRDDDDRNDVITKRDIYLNEIQGKYRIRFVLDDRPRVVRMWRGEMGLTVFQVGPNVEF